jgi:hypothetical protein
MRPFASSEHSFWPVGVAVNIPDFQSGDEEFESPTGYGKSSWFTTVFFYKDRHGKMVCSGMNTYGK